MPSHVNLKDLAFVLEGLRHLLLLRLLPSVTATSRPSIRAILAPEPSHRQTLQTLDGSDGLVCGLSPLRSRSPGLQRHVLTFQQRLEIAIGAAEGLRYLHSFAKPPIIHRDVKSDNILLDNEMQAKVADFGVFKHLQASGPPGSTVNTKVVGTPGYLDPEYYQTYKVTPKSDVYSFGVVLLELLTGHPSIMSDPASGNKNVMVTLARWAIPKIVAGKVESIIDPNLVDFPRQAVQMLGSVAAMCVRRSGKERPEMAEVATRLNEIKYFIQPSSGLLEPVHFDEDLDALGSIPEFIPGVPTESSVLTGSSAEQNTAPVSMVFSDR